MSRVKNKDGWVRPAHTIEQMFDEMHNAGFMNTCYTITLNARVPLLASQVHEALQQLYRKLPNLRMSLQKAEDGTQWLREMQREQIDFELLDNADLEEELQTMLGYHFNVTDGPMWCTRLIPARSDDACIMQEVKQEFSYQYYLNYCIHHAISDGFTNMNIIGYFLEILNSSIGGECLDSDVQLGYHDDGSQTEKRVDMKRREFELNPDVKAKKIAILKDNKNKIPLLSRVNRTSTHIIPSTQTIAVNLDKEMTKKLFTKCKNEKVSVHSGWCALSNAALVEMMKDGGLDQNSYKVRFEHSVNLRRYWEGDTSKAFGPHVGNIRHTSNVYKETHQSIWEYARSLQEEFYSKLNGADVFEWGILSESTETPENEAPKFQIPSPACRDYFISNMGKIDPMIPEALNHIQMTHIRRVTAIQMLGCPMSQNMQTYQGHFFYSCNYCPNYISTETAELFVKKLLTLMRDNI